MKDDGEIRLEHGSGGALSRDLVENVIHPFFRSDSYSELLDAGPLEDGSDLLMTTDGYVVDPPFFPGGDIGRLSIFGTCNDLAVSGAKAICISLALVIEEGFPVADLRRALASAAEAARGAEVRIITGDTKVVPRGKGGGLFITTTGVGRRVFPLPLSPGRVEAGDALIVSAPIGSHGLTVLAARESLPVAESLRSDMACLYPSVSALFPLAEKLRFMRDATRGGIASVLNEVVRSSPLGIAVEDEAFPVTDEVRTVSSLLGLNPLEIANEGVFIAVVAGSAKDQALDVLHSHPLGRDARVVGRVSADAPGRVLVTTRVGGTRFVDFPRGLLLPRIC
ncbi:MAG: hydrogenase expression/formation protein HypE [Spirochaetia bacterium]|jgi:hydrogenase expression/formation protein HypE